MAAAADPGASWDEVADQLSDLGLKLKLHFEQVAAAPDGATEDDGAVRDAVDEVGQAIDRAMTMLGNAARDEAVQQDARDLGVALVQALDATFTSLGDRFRAQLDRPSG